MKPRALVLVCKTYRNDIVSFQRFFNSFLKHNAENLSLYISVPLADVRAFSEIVAENAKVIADEDYAAEYMTKDSYWGLTPGYVNQEICKLTFWKNEIADNYLFIDSDAYFIRDFTLQDFMVDDKTPYSVLVMDKDLNIENFYRDFGAWRKHHIQKIFDAVELKDKRLLTCHGMTIMNTGVLRDFESNFLQKNNLTYSGLIQISPYEYSWYNAWLQKCRLIDIIAVEPFFKTFHMRLEYTFSRLSLIKEGDIAKEYVGIILNSNWKRKPPVRYKDPGILDRVFNKIFSKLV